MEVADVLYGVSMGPDGTSKVLSQRMAADGELETTGEPGQDTLDSEQKPAAIAG